MTSILQEKKLSASALNAIHPTGMVIATHQILYHLHTTLGPQQRAEKESPSAQKLCDVRGSARSRELNDELLLTTTIPTVDCLIVIPHAQHKGAVTVIEMGCPFCVNSCTFICLYSMNLYYIYSCVLLYSIVFLCYYTKNL